MNGKQRCLAAVRGEPVDRTPAFPLLMFLAADRLGVSYQQYATNAHILAEARFNVREQFGVDAITACSDAFRVSADLGGEMVYPEDGTPYLARPLVGSESGLRRLRRPDPSASKSRLADKLLAIGEMARAAGADCLVLGWVDMPFAEACSICGVTEFMVMLIDDPARAHNAAIPDRDRDRFRAGAGSSGRR